MFEKHPRKVTINCQAIGLIIVKVLVELGDFMPETLRFKLYHLIQCRMYCYLSGQIHLKKIPSSTRPLSHREKRSHRGKVEEYDETYHTMLRKELWTELSRRIWEIYLHGIYQQQQRNLEAGKRESFSKYGLEIWAFKTSLVWVSW